MEVIPGNYSKTVLSRRGQPTGVAVEYCGWLDGDVCAFHDGRAYQVHVIDGASVGVRDSYRETTASALLGRMLWLRVRGCDYPVEALGYLVADLVVELDADEGRWPKQ
jgi:hypothetical protein